jgi:hypothetical protein
VARSAAKSGRDRETHCGDDGFDEPFGSLVSTALPL